MPSIIVYPGSSALSGIFNVKAYGAKGDGITDDTAAINAAFAASNASRINIAHNQGGVESYILTEAKGAVFYPFGLYKISAPVGLDSNDTTVIGDRALLFSTDRTIPLLSLGTFNNIIDGMIFNGGAYHIRFGGARIESGQMYIVNCQFRNAKKRCIITDRTDIPGSAGYPANLRIDKCKSYGSGFLESYCNGTTIFDSWLAWDVSATSWDGGALIIANDNIRMENVAEIPFGINAAQYPRFQDANTYGAEDTLNVLAIGSRFGGEALATPVVHFRSKGSSVILDTCAVYGVASSYWAKFDAIPSLVAVKTPYAGEDSGFVNTYGMWFKNTLTVDDLPPLCRMDLDLRSVYANAYRCVTSADSFVDGGPRFALIASKPVSIPQVMDNYDIGDGFTFWTFPYSTDAYLSAFGGAASLLGSPAGMVSFSGEGYYSIRFPSFTPPAAGIYTFSVWVNASERNPWYFYAKLGGPTIDSGFMEPGMNRITVSFYSDGTPSTPVFGMTGRAGDTFIPGFFTFNQGNVAATWELP